MSDRPDSGFEYGGVLVDLGDLYLNGRMDETRANNYLGNTHGGLLNIGNDWYIFYHRQTNRSSYARQACAEKLERTPEGGFLQAEVTSCGLNGGPLQGAGRYEARIACNLWANGHTTGRVDGSSPKKRLKAHPYFTQTGKDREEEGDQYIANMQNGAVAGYKYFHYTGDETSITLDMGGTGKGMMRVAFDDAFRRVAAEVPVSLSGVKTKMTGTFNTEPGIHPLYIMYQGEGSLDFHAFEIK